MDIVNVRHVRDILSKTPSPAFGTVADSKINPGTGTVVDPANINDDNPGSGITADEINKYNEIDFGKIVQIRQVRQYGHTFNSGGDGAYKVRWYDGRIWRDWIIGVVPRATADWSPFSVISIREATKIKMVHTALDSHFGASFLQEFEVKY